MNIQRWIKEHLAITGIILTLSSIFLFLLLWYLYPDIIYDQFIWKYFWGPILSDGLGKPLSYQGVDAAPKFTLVSEIVYGIIVAGALYGVYRLLKKWNIIPDFSFFVGLFPFILYGTFARVLEDAHLFAEPVVFWFVTPLIYIQVLVLTLVVLFIATYLHRIKKVTKWTVPQIMGGIGIFMILPFLYYIILWMIGENWSVSDGLFPQVFLLVMFLSISIAIAVFGLAHIIRPYWKNSTVFASPLNLSLIFGHQLDGIATYISIYDPLKMGLPSYIEKHPASDALLQLWPPLFPIVKFLLIIGIIYLLDVLYKDELQSQRTFANLLKIGIFILGFAPGLRDLLRVMMGV